MLQGLPYVSIHLFFIYSEEFTVFVKNSAIYHGHCNVAALCAVAQHGKGIKCGQHMGTVKVKGDDVCLVAYGYAAAVGTALYSCAVYGGHFEHFSRLHYGRVVVVAVVNNGG